LNLKKMKKSRYLFCLFSLLAGLFLGTRCSQESSSENSFSISSKDPQKKDKIVLKVEDYIYTNSDFKKYVQNIVGDDQESLSIPSLSRLYDEFVEEKILLQVARRQNISLTAEEKNEYLNRFSAEFAFRSDPESLKDWDERAIFEKLLVEKCIYRLVKDINVEDEKIHEYYDLHREEFLQPERVHVSQISVETEEKASEILERVKNLSEQDFGKIARAESVGPDAIRGGQMGVFKPGELPFKIEKVIFSLKEGEVSPVVKSSYGYHIFRLNKKHQPELVSVEEASPSIKRKILDQKTEKFLSSYLEELKKEIPWQSYPENLSFLYERNVS